MSTVLKDISDSCDRILTEMSQFSPSVMGPDPALHLAQEAKIMVAMRAIFDDEFSELEPEQQDLAGPPSQEQTARAAVPKPLHSGE